MIKIERAEMDKLLIERRTAFEYAQKHYEQLRADADNAEIILYGSKCDGLGKLCPSLINYRIYKKLKKGRFLKKMPQNDLYTVYEFDNSNVPKRLRAYNEFGCSQSIYFYEQNGYQYAIPFIGDTNDDYCSRIYKYLLKNGRVMEYYEIEGSRVIGEKYDYSQLNKGYIECYLFNYLNFEFCNISSHLIEAINAKLQNIRSVNRVNIAHDIIRQEDYCYRIFLENEKITNIDEYKIIDGELSFSRNIKC